MMTDPALKSHSLAARLDRLIESLQPPVKTATLAAVPVAATGHLGPLPALGLVALERSLEFGHGLVHPLAHDAGNGGCESPHEVQHVHAAHSTAIAPQEAQDATQNESLNHAQTCAQNANDFNVTSAVEPPSQTQNEPQQRPAQTQQTPATTERVDNSQNVHNEMGMGL